MTRAPDRVFDLLVVGGGINGVGIARDAAGRGLAVLLAEKGDLARATSSAATKLIHGGLRYLEQYEFRLVREALAEREVLLHMAPHIIWPLRFVLPHDRHLRPAWMIRVGLFLYDHLGGRTILPGSVGVDLTRAPEGRPLKDDYRKGFAYSDCWVDDARLVVLNAVALRDLGGVVLTRTSLVTARREGELWRATLKNERTGEIQEVAARGLVNAAGPWVGSVLSGALGINARAQVRHVKGSHIVVPKLYDGAHAYIFQHPDGRVIFAIPYEGRFTLVGTTDIPYQGDLEQPTIDGAETEYLCNAVSRYFATPITPEEVVWSYSGVRPLYDDGSADPSEITRDYVLQLDEGRPPLLSVYGGKLTTYRRLAEHAMEKLEPYYPGLKPAWTSGPPLPGGDFGGRSFDALVADLVSTYPAIDRALLASLARRQGTRSRAVLGDARTVADLGRDFGGGLYAREIEYLVANEWAETADDILWRRTKLGLHLPPGGAQQVARYLAERK